MAPRIFRTRCGKCLFLGLLAAATVSALLALTRVARFNRPLLANSWAASRVDRVADAAGSPSLPGRGSDNASSSSDLVKMRERVKVLEARLTAELSRQLERGDGNDGQPLKENPRRIFKELTKYPFKEDAHYEESTCPKRISSLAQYSKWFKDRYRPRIKVFLDKDDIANFTDIARSELPFGYRSEHRELFENIMNHPRFTNAPLHPSGARKQCLRCAVIGCGGILKESRAGPEIDSHDYVFRLNYAVTTGRFEKDVGRKTSFYIFFPESMSVANVLDKDAKFIYTMFKTYDMNYAINMFDNKEPPKYVYGRSQVLNLSKPNVDPAKVKIVHPDFFRYVFAEYLDALAYRPTTGAMTVFLALHLCDEVTIYGFGYDPRFTMHYYDTNFVKHTDSSTGSHDVDNERHLWAKLHEEGVIRLFKRDV